MSAASLPLVMPSGGIGKKFRNRIRGLGKAKESPMREAAPVSVETLSTLIDYLYQIGAEQTEGIFRISGRSEKIKLLFDSLKDRGGPKFPTMPEPEGQHIHTVASALKLYLSRVEPPIFLPDTYDALTSRGTKLDIVPKLDDLRNDINQLPPVHKECLSLLLKFLIFIVSNSQKNKMTVTNCAIVFAPVLIRAKIESYEYIFHLQGHCRIIERLIEHYEFYFGSDPSSSSSSAAAPSSSFASSSSSSSLLGSQSLDQTNDDTDDASEIVEEDQSEDEELFIPEDTTVSTVPHKWKKKNFNAFQSVICKSCKKMIKTGLLGTTGCVCSVCNMPIHRACKDNLPLGCNPDSGAKKVHTVTVGSKAPDFSFVDNQGNTFSLSKTAQEGKKIVLFFYPKAFTPACTIQNKTIRDAFSLFHYASCEVVGVSSDTVSCHKRFIEKYNLPFRMISDPENRLRELFQVPSDFNGLAPGRVTYVIAPYTMTIASIFSSQLQAREHALSALEIVTKMLIAEQRGETWDSFAEVSAQD